MSKVQRTFMLPRDLDRALGHAAVDADTDKSTLIVKALEAYLPTLKTLEKVAS